METKTDNIKNEACSQDNVNSSSAEVEATNAVSSVKNERFSRRNLIRGGVAAAVVGAGAAFGLPKVGQAAEDEAATKQDLASLEQELSLLTKASDDSEVTAHKVTKIEASVTDQQYPSAKAVYDAITEKINRQQSEADSGKIFIVNDSGKLVLSAFTTDVISGDSTLPVQARTIYAALKTLNDSLSSLDKVPTKGSEHGVLSSGVYETYQSTVDIADFSALQNAVNYKYTGTGITNSKDNEVFSVKKIDTTLIAISQDDPSAVYTSNDNGQTWSLPYGGW